MISASIACRGNSISRSGTLQPLRRVLLQDTQQIARREHARLQGGLFVRPGFVQLLGQRVYLGDGNRRIEIIVERLVKRLVSEADLPIDLDILHIAQGAVEAVQRGLCLVQQFG